MEKIQLQQIKTFFVRHYSNPIAFDKAVNEYIIELYVKNGNYPKIETNSNFICIISNVLINIDRS